MKRREKEYRKRNEALMLQRWENENDDHHGQWTVRIRIRVTGKDKLTQTPL